MCCFVNPAKICFDELAITDAMNFCALGQRLASSCLSVDYAVFLIRFCTFARILRQDYQRKPLHVDV